jgi:hypothetical protein
LQLLSFPSQTSGPFAPARPSRVALASRSSEFVAYAEAVMTTSPSLQPGCAFAVICTVTWLPAPSVGDVT